VEDDPERVPPAGPHRADAVAQVDAIYSLRAANGPVMHGKGHRVAPPQGHHGGARLHARPLLGEDELAAGEVLVRLRQQDRDLQGEDVLAIEVLMQAVEIAGTVLQQERCRVRLARIVTTLQKRPVRRRMRLAMGANCG
jgi:hypothetical protein